MVTQEYVDKFEVYCNQYISQLESMRPEEAKKVARESLIRTGVLDKDGNAKEQIVTGDFFGW